MFTIKTLNAISPVGLTKLNKNLFDVSVDADAPDGILVRSADLLNTTFNDGLLAIARAGAGVNNIPLDRCSEQGIVVFNTPGANANAVAELVIGMLIAGSRNVPAAAQWTQGLAGDPAMAKSVEKGKKQFVGNEIKALPTAIMRRLSPRRRTGCSLKRRWQSLPRRQTRVRRSSRNCWRKTANWLHG